MSRRFRGAVISGTAPTITSSKASGVWTLRQNFQNIPVQWPVETLVPSPILYLSFYQTLNLDSRLTLTRNSSATYFDALGTLITVGTDTPRFDHDPLTGNNLGLLIEGSSTNICLRSEEFQTSWTTNNVSVSINTIDSLDEVTAADSILETASDSTHSIGQTITVDSTTDNFSFSVFVKSINRRYGYIRMSTEVNGSQSITCEFDLTSKSTSVSTIGTASSLTSKITECRNGWFRISCTGKTAQSGPHVFSLGIKNDSNISSYLGETTKGFYTWGYQVEQGDSATSYIKTTTSPESRSADNLDITANDFSSWFKPSQGTLLWRGTISRISPSATYKLLEISDSTSDESILLSVDNSSTPINKIKYSVVDGGNEQISISSAGSAARDTEYRVTMGYGSDDFLFSVNGEIIGEDTAGTLPTVSKINLGSGIGGNHFYGHIKEISYWNRRLDTEVTRLISSVSYNDARSLILEFDKMENLDSRISFSRNSTASYFNSIGVLSTASANVPRIDYHPLTHQNLGLFVEESRTNLILRSADLSDSYWTKSNVTVSADNSVSPDGTTSADLILEEATVSAHQIVRSETIDSTTAYYTFSVFVKAAGRTKGSLVVNASNNYFLAEFDLTSKTISGSSTGTGQHIISEIQELDNDWYRISTTGRTGQNSVTSLILRLNDDDINLTYLGDITKGMFAWGFQLEQGGSVTSYIPTVGSTVTRESDVATLSGVDFSDWFNPSEGTFYWQGSLYALSYSADQVALTVSDGSADEKMILSANYKSSPSENKTARFVVTDNSTDVVSLNSPALLINAETEKQYKISISYKLNDFSVSLNSNTESVDITGSLPSVDRLNIGSNQTGSASLNGHVARLYYWNNKQPAWLISTLKKKI